VATAAMAAVAGARPGLVQAVDAHRARMIAMNSPGGAGGSTNSKKPELALEKEPGGPGLSPGPASSPRGSTSRSSLDPELRLRGSRVATMTRAATGTEWFRDDLRPGRFGYAQEGGDYE